MATYLINASHEQKIATEEYGAIKVLVYSNPAYYEPKSLARDFGEIEKGDIVIICRDSELKFLAEVEANKRFRFCRNVWRGRGHFRH